MDISVNTSLWIGSFVSTCGLEAFLQVGYGGVEQVFVQHLKPNHEQTLVLLLILCNIFNKKLLLLLLKHSSM